MQIYELVKYQSALYSEPDESTIFYTIQSRNLSDISTLKMLKQYVDQFVY